MASTPPIYGSRPFGLCQFELDHQNTCALTGNFRYPEHFRMSRSGSLVFKDRGPNISTAKPSLASTMMAAQIGVSLRPAAPPSSQCSRKNSAREYAMRCRTKQDIPHHRFPVQAIYIASRSHPFVHATRIADTQEYTYY